MDPKRKLLIDIFLEYNTKINLSSIREPEEVYTKHILDSLELNNLLTFEKWQKILDIGTGGGFPLLPLAMTNPQSNFVGVDARRKKIGVVNKMIEELNIPNAKAKRSRIEEFNGKFDIITVRAVGYVDKLFDRTKHLFHPGLTICLYKQESSEELEMLKKLSLQYRFDIKKIHQYTLVEDDIHRVIYVLKKK